MSITVVIYEKDLIAKNACEQGKAFWRQIAEQSKRSKKGALRVKVTWTITHQLWFAVAAPSFYGWARETGLVPQISMANANLHGADLRYADLRYANLSYSNLYGANLYGANLHGANLYGANLGGANLGGASLSGANLGDWERGPNGFAQRKST